CIVAMREATAQRPRIICRRAGDKYLLVEYGPIVLDLELRFRIHVLMTRLEARALSGVIDVTPGIRSLQIHYDSRILSLESLLAELSAIEDAIGDTGDIEVPSRLVHMPLSWNDAAVQLTIDKYMQSVRADAPWCPSNIEFIRRINGLDSIDDVFRVVFDASYLVLGLGDVYLGAPVATPVDPRHRLVTTKYNPARTWTPDNVVGIGGAYMCIYGMEGPGGYQLFGRTSQVWNTYRRTPAFTGGKPWLLRFFDQVKFYSVSNSDLSRIRDGVIDGTSAIRIEKTTFSMKDYRAFLAANAAAISDAKFRQQAAFDAERGRWKESDRSASAVASSDVDTDDQSIPLGAHAIESTVPGCVWKITVEEGAHISAGDVVVVVESMKMEMSIVAPSDGIVLEIRCGEGKPVALGQTLIVMKAHASEAVL
ncbi:MAG: carboxyltransferase domain-containing protein, partial [Hyphomicrobium sp.]